MDARTKEYFSMRPLVVQKLIWEIEIQGHRITAKVFKPFQQPPPSATGRKIKTFSNASRLRMLKFIAGIDWSEYAGGKFITLTYPDQLWPNNNYERNIHRSVFSRSMEKHLGQKVPALWRVEWVPRETGKHKGKFLPHIHLLTFRGQWFHMDHVNDLWKKAIGWRRYCRTEIEGIENEKKCGFYVSKYCAKVDPSLSLVNPPNLNNTGRHYGYLRRKLIPLCPRTRFTGLDAKFASDLQEIGARSLPWYTPEYDGGFSLLGERADGVRDEISRLAIDAGFVVTYPDS